MHKRINICLDYKVYAKLKDRGRFGESFSDLVLRILDESGKISLKTTPLEVTTSNV